MLNKIVCLSVKVLVSLATVTFIGHFGYEYEWWKLCDLEFAFEHPLVSRSATREFAISGIPLCKQEFVLQEAAGTVLKVRT